MSDVLESPPHDSRRWLFLARSRAMLGRSSALAMFSGAAAGGALAILLAPALRPMFAVPGGGIGAITRMQYPKGWDYAVVGLIVVIAALCALLAGVLSGLPRQASSGLPDPEPFSTARRRFRWIATLAVFVLMIFVHDHPYLFMDMFHEGERLTPASVLLDGGRPYKDIFFLHGFAVDGGLDALVIGDPPSLLRPRRLQTILDAATLALLVPIAVEVCATATGAAFATLAGLSAVAAGWLPVFPFFRWAPLLGAVLLFLLYVRTPRRRFLVGALSAASLGLLWSLEIGTYSVAASAGVLVWLFLQSQRPPAKDLAIAAATALALPVVILLLTRADLMLFLRDSFVIAPGSIDAIWSLPAPALPDLASLLNPKALLTWLDSEAARYYLPSAFYGFLLALGLRESAAGRSRNAARVIIVALFSIIVFRSAAGRVGWSHIRFGIPLLGIAMTAFALEPAALRLKARGRQSIVAGLLLLLAAVPFVRYVEIPENLEASRKLITGWPARNQHDGLVHYPTERGRGIFTYPKNREDLAAILAFNARFPEDASMFDLSNERAIYWFLARRPAVRNPDLAMLSNPRLGSEALAQLRERPPAFVILEGLPELAQFDGILHRERIPGIAVWIDENYPNRETVGRWVVGLPAADAHR